MVKTAKLDEEVLAAFNQLLQLDPNNAETYYNKGYRIAEGNEKSCNYTEKLETYIMIASE